MTFARARINPRATAGSAAAPSATAVSRWRASSSRIAETTARVRASSGESRPDDVYRILRQVQEGLQRHPVFCRRKAPGCGGPELGIWIAGEFEQGLPVPVRPQLRQHSEEVGAGPASGFHPLLRSLCQAAEGPGVP